MNFGVAVCKRCQWRHLETMSFQRKPCSVGLFTPRTQEAPTKSHEQDLLSQQHAKNVSIFSCNAYAVYSDAKVDLGGGLSTIQVTDKEGDFHFAKRKTTGSWVNIGMFKQIRKEIGSAGTYKGYDWTVKSDPDAVFLLSRLVQRIKWLPRPEQGIYLVNCQLVDNGFFGNLEVFSSQGFGILIANPDTCNTQIDWKTGVKGGKFGPMGEDLFAEKCMEKNGVPKLQRLTLVSMGLVLRIAQRTCMDTRSGTATVKMSSVQQPSTHLRNQRSISIALMIPRLQPARFGS